MNLRTMLAIVAVLAVVGQAALVVVVLAQGEVNLSIDDVSFEDHPHISFRATVRNSQGIPIVDVRPDQFSIVEDMRHTVAADEVAAVINPDAVVSVLFAIDVSGSMQGEHIEQAIRAANEFMDRLNEADRVAVVAFADNVDVDPANLDEEREHPFTTDKNAIRNVINFLGSRIDPDSDTPLYDAVYKSVKLASGEPVGKRAIIVLTDGREEGRPKRGTGSLFTGDDSINEATRSRVPVFTIGLGNDIDSAYLRRLALLTGGEYQETPNPEELSQLTQNALDQLKQEYLVRFETSLPYDVEPHSYIVRVALPQGEAMTDYEFVFREATPTLVAQVSPTAEPEPTEPEPTVAVAITEAETAQVVGTAEPEPTDVSAELAPIEQAEDGGFLGGIRDKVEEMMDENPVLLIGIGVGVLVLVVLIVALVVVLVRGRRAQKGAVAPAAYEEPYAPHAEPFAAAGYPAESDWTAGPEPTPSASATAMPGGPLHGRTEAAPADWGVARPAAAPFGAPPMPQAAAPMGGMGGGDEIPLAGGTRVIERRSGQSASLVDRGNPARRFRLVGTTTVGRGTDNEIVLSHPTVSRRHAWLREEADGWLVADAGSANGTFVNGQRVTEPRRLRNGDIVGFGKAEFSFEVFGA